jgi:hypothetical protein
MAFLTKRSQNAQPFPKEMIRGIGELTNKQKAFVHTKALLATIILINPNIIKAKFRSDSLAVDAFKCQMIRYSNQLD